MIKRGENRIGRYFKERIKEKEVEKVRMPNNNKEFHPEWDVFIQSQAYGKALEIIKDKFLKIEESFKKGIKASLDLWKQIEKWIVNEKGGSRIEELEEKFKEEIEGVLHVEHKYDFNYDCVICGKNLYEGFS